ncbi:MAG TPA: SRPBCC family protein [Solirubrobacterales bacterium]
MVFALVSDPYNLPRWWPRTARVEAVDFEGGGSGDQWTQVLETEEGRSVRADFRCLSAIEGERYAWEQQLEGTPFERHLRRATVEIGIRASEGATDVTIASEQALRGLSRLGSMMMRRGQGKIVDEALDGIERALAGGAE